MKNGGRIPWSVSTNRELSDGKTPYERRFGEPLKGPINNSFSFDGRISSCFCQRPVEIPPILSESLSWNIPRLRLVCGVNLERRHFGRRH